MFDAEFELEEELESLMDTLAHSDLESEAEGETPVSPARRNRDQTVISGQFARGIKDENKLTDAVFDDRHPEWTGKLLTNANLTLRQEWMQIRDGAVRPFLQHPPAVQPPVKPAAPPTPVHPTPAAPGGDTYAFSTFDNIRAYSPDQLQAAFAAQTAYRKVSSFLPWYKKITNAVTMVSISESDTGIGNLVFSMNTRAFTDLVEDEGLKSKVLEIAAGGATESLIFSEDVIGMVGLGVALLEIAQGLENDRMQKGAGPDNAAWRMKQQYQFVFGLMAEDLSRRNFGDGYFFSRDPRDLAVELAARFAEFRPIFLNYQHYYELDFNLAKYQGNIPDRPVDTMSAPPPGL
jgi:hypothetical protein